MSKATANKAIDFSRLFEVKDKLASQALEAVDEGAPNGGEERAPSDAPPSSLAPNGGAVGEGKVLDFPAATIGDGDSSAAPAPTPPAVVTQMLPSAPDGASQVAREGKTGSLRVGMPRAFHQRVRAAAAMACTPPVVFARQLLEGAAPRLEADAPLTDLVRRACEAFPRSAAPRATEVRMQVPVPESLHRTYLQIAALRGQTLGACLLEALEDRLPR